jgi:adenine-specific DNA-methyltransferase
VDVGKERYGMNWPGKADCFRTIQAPSRGTLRPSPEESPGYSAAISKMYGLNSTW